MFCGGCKWGPVGCARSRPRSPREQPVPEARSRRGLRRREGRPAAPQTRAPRGWKSALGPFTMLVVVAARVLGIDLVLRIYFYYFYRQFYSLSLSLLLLLLLLSVCVFTFLISLRFIDTVIIIIIVVFVIITIFIWITLDYQYYWFYQHPLLLS